MGTLLYRQVTGMARRGLPNRVEELKLPSLARSAASASVVPVATGGGGGGHTAPRISRCRPSMWAKQSFRVMRLCLGGGWTGPGEGAFLRALYPCCGCCLFAFPAPSCTPQPKPSGSCCSSCTPRLRPPSSCTPHLPRPSCSAECCTACWAPHPSSP